MRFVLPWKTISISPLRVTTCRSQTWIFCALKQAEYFAASIRAWCRALPAAGLEDLALGHPALEPVEPRLALVARAQAPRDWCSPLWASAQPCRPTIL